MSYTDSTPPTAWTGDLRSAIAGETGATVPKVSYAVYTDSSTWSGWETWAEQNALDYDNTSNYSSRAIQVTAYWPTILADFTDDNGDD